VPLVRLGWVDRIGEFRVERIRDVHRTGSSVDLAKPPVCVMHTTQTTWDKAVARFRSELTAPTFQIAPNRIGQCVPLGEAAAALKSQRGGGETNLWTRVQIEIVFSVTDPPHRRPWLPDEGLLAVLVPLMRFLREDCDIPLERPFPHDDLLEGTLASEAHAPRHSGKWGHAPGYWGHVEVPENDHWDPGNLDYRELFERAKNVQNVARTLRIALPRMTGEDVEEAQRLLERNPFGNFAPGPINRTFGLLTAQACSRAKFALGYPQDDIKGTFGPTLKAFLSGKRGLPPDYRARRAARKAKAGFRSPAFEASREIHP
jgi:hypothetical protein